MNSLDECKAFQIFISDTIAEKDKVLPPILNMASKNFRDSLPKKHSYKFFDKENVIEFIKNNFDLEVLKAFHKLKPYAYKKDLASYCIAYTSGGWYSDITIKIISQILTVPNNIEFVCFRDHGFIHHPLSLNYGIQTSLFYTRRANPIFSKAIEYVLENCKNENYGVSPVCPTGPGLLGRAHAFYGSKSTQVMGTFMRLSPFHQNMNKSYLFPDGTILALHKDAWIKGCQEGDLSKVVGKGTNNYLDMYNSQDIYCKSY